MIDDNTARACAETVRFLLKLHQRSGKLKRALQGYTLPPGDSISRAIWRLRDQRVARRTARAYGLGFSSGRSHRAGSVDSDGEGGAGSDDDSNSEWEDLSSPDESD
jgi:hypothetical protein